MHISTYIHINTHTSIKYRKYIDIVESSELLLDVKSRYMESTLLY